MSGDLLCPGCGGEDATGATYPSRCTCGGLWIARDDVYAELGTGDGFTGFETPLWQDPEDARLLWKREDLNRTGSFKDRGAEILVELAVKRGARSGVVDSSGSAALAMASASARMELPVIIHTPDGLPVAKREALTALGANLVAEGTRSEAGHRATEAAADSFHLSHVFHPAFLEGTSRAASETLRQCADHPPLNWVIPVGNGSLLLGLALGLQRLGRTDVRLVAAQSASCPGLNRPGTGGNTRAAGIGIADPPRRAQILEALDQSGGEVVEVEESEIAAAHQELWKRGVAAELASAAALAAVHRLRATGDTDRILAWLTGCGHRGS
jgi:threonine synthase